MNANGNGTDTEWIQNGNGTDTEWIQNGNGTDTEWVQNGYRTGMGNHTEQKRNAFCQAFPVRFLLISTVNLVQKDLAIGHSTWKFLKL